MNKYICKKNGGKVNYSEKRRTASFSQDVKKFFRVKKYLTLIKMREETTV